MESIRLKLDNSNSKTYENEKFSIPGKYADKLKIRIITVLVCNFLFFIRFQTWMHKNNYESVNGYTTYKGIVCDISNINWRIQL